MQLRPSSYLLHTLNTDTRFSLLSLLLFVLYCILSNTEQTTEVSHNKSLQKQQFSNAPTVKFKQYAQLRDINLKSNSSALIFFDYMWPGYVAALHLLANVSDVSPSSVLLAYGWWQRLIKYGFKTAWVTLSNHLAHHFSFTTSNSVNICTTYVWLLLWMQLNLLIGLNIYPFFFSVPMNSRFQTQHALSLQKCSCAC